jgi:hypothetical protein
MSATSQRDKVAKLAKTNPEKALVEARRISEPWFRAQALSWVARFTDGDPVPVAQQAANAAAQCEDEYKQTAVRAWEIAALAERDKTSEARVALNATLRRVADVTPLSSKAEALALLLHAAARIGEDDARNVAEVLRFECGGDFHWRCKRAIRDCGEIVEKEAEPRPFFW